MSDTITLLKKQQELAESHFYSIEEEINDITEQIAALQAKRIEKRSKSNEVRSEVSQILREIKATERYS